MARQPITLNFWHLGINSLLPPAEIAKNQYAWGENIINRGGIIQTRPGRRVLNSIKGSNPQGIAIFKPKGSTPRIVAAVDGFVYTLSYPKFEPVKLEGVKFSPTAKRVHFCEAIKSIQRNADESLKVIDPLPVLIMQDGTTQAAYWDGGTARHLDPSINARETPIGTWMAWISSRLWVVNGTKVFVGDLQDPLSHTEAQYLLSRDSFELPGECTGLIPTANRTGLLAFTSRTTTAFKVTERDRTKWANIENFQDLILPEVGCVSGWSACNQYGTTHWMSDKGLVNFDSAFSTTQSSKLVTEDEAMMRSRRKLAPGMDVACSIAFENLLFVSVPSGSKHNEHTWVMDQSALTADDKTGVWASIWTGTRPVQWATGELGGQNRLINLSYDRSAKNDTRIHVWEEMLSDRSDEGGRIACQFITGAAMANELLRFKFARVEAVEIYGEVDLKVYVAGTRGPWYEIGSYRFQAERGCFGSSKMPLIKSDSIIREFRPQARSFETQEFSAEDKVSTKEQEPYVPGIDRGFMMRFDWVGRFGIREITMTVDAGPAENHGAPACLDATGGEIGPNAISESGETV